MNVTLTTEHHTHAGKPCIKGDVIDVTPEQAQWLADQGLIKPLTKLATPSKRED